MFTVFLFLLSTKGIRNSMIRNDAGDVISTMIQRIKMLVKKIKNINHIAIISPPSGAGFHSPRSAIA